MGLSALTHTLQDTDVIPQSESDWDQWLSATRTRAYLLHNPLTDWLERYGTEKGFVRDTDLPGYDERLEFLPFNLAKT